MSVFPQLREFDMSDIGSKEQNTINKDQRIAELERQLRTAKEEQMSAYERSETLRQMLMEINDEFANLLSNADIGAMVLDRELRIQSVTPGIRGYFHIRPDDIGRPLTDLASNLLYNNLAEDVTEVIATSKFKEVVVPSNDGRWFSMRISPHQLLEGDIDGVVISMADISYLKDREAELQDRSEKILGAIQKSPIVVWNQDRDFRYTWIHNPHPGFRQEEVLGKTDEELLPADEAEVLRQIKQKVLDTGVRVRENVTTTIGGKTYYYDLAVEALTDENANIVGVSCASMEISKEEYELRKHHNKNHY